MGVGICWTPALTVIGYRSNSERIDRFVVFLENASSCFKRVIWNISNLLFSNKFLKLVSIFRESAQDSHAYNKMGLTSESYSLRYMSMSMFLFFEEER